MPALLTVPRRSVAHLLPAGEQHRQTGVSGAVPAQRARVPVLRAEAGFDVTDELIDIARVEYYLDEWAYAQGQDRGARGYLGATPGITSGTVSSTFDDMYDRSILAIIRHVDAVIPELPLHEQSAIFVHYGQANVYTFKRIDQDKALADGKLHVGEGLRRRGVPVGREG